MSERGRVAHGAQHRVSEPLLKDVADIPADSAAIPAAKDEARFGQPY